MDSTQLTASEGIEDSSLHSSLHPHDGQAHGAGHDHGDGPWPTLLHSSFFREPPTEPGKGLSFDAPVPSTLQGHVDETSQKPKHALAGTRAGQPSAEAMHEQQQKPRVQAHVHRSRHGTTEQETIQCDDLLRELEVQAHRDELRNAAQADRSKFAAQHNITSMREHELSKSAYDDKMAALQADHYNDVEKRLQQASEKHNLTVADHSVSAGQNFKAAMTKHEAWRTQQADDTSQQQTAELHFEQVQVHHDELRKANLAERSKHAAQHNIASMQEHKLSKSTYDHELEALRAKHFRDVEERLDQASEKREHALADRSLRAGQYFNEAMTKSKAWQAEQEDASSQRQAAKLHLDDDQSVGLPR